MLRITERVQLESVNEIYNLGLTPTNIDNLYKISTELMSGTSYTTSIKKRADIVIKVGTNNYIEIFKKPADTPQEAIYTCGDSTLFMYAFNPKKLKLAGLTDLIESMFRTANEGESILFEDEDHIKKYFLQSLVDNSLDFDVWWSDDKITNLGKYLDVDVTDWKRKLNRHSNELTTVLGVYEHKNPSIRVVFLSDCRVIRSTPEDPNYNWYDTGRLFYEDESDYTKKLFFEDLKPWVPSDLSILTRLLNSNIRVASNKQIKAAEFRLERQKKSQLEERETSSILEKKLHKKLHDFCTKGTAFQYEGVSFDKDAVEYEGQKLSGLHFPDALKYLANSPLVIDFNRLVRTFAQHAIHLVTNGSKALELQIGDVKAIIEYRGALIYINDRRITHEDAEAVLTRATCFTKQEDYDSFIEDVSKCSLRFNRLFATGILLENVLDSLTGDQVTTKIPVFRKKNKNYLLINKHEYQIKDTNKLIRAQNVKDVATLVSILTNPEIVIGMKPKDIGYLITDGAAAYKKECEQENAFLSDTMKQFNVEYTPGEFLENGTTVSGYKVTGHMRNYIIRESDQNVFEMPSGKYLCMVDKNFNEISKTNKIIARIYALSNDSALIKEISTLA